LNPREDRRAHLAFTDHLRFDLISDMELTQSYCLVAGVLIVAVLRRVVPVEALKPVESTVPPTAHSIGGSASQSKCCAMGASRLTSHDQGEAGHSLPEPTVRFHETDADGFRALAIVMSFDLPVLSLRRFWTMTYGEPTGPHGS
jgi:hypothetical protein